MVGVVDIFMVYQFVKRLATPFDEWKAYELGIIDEDGNILIDKRDRRRDRKLREAFGKFDLLVLKLKKLLEKVPGGQSRIGSYAAALWLIKENHEKEPTQESLLEYMKYSEDLLIEEPTMSAGSGVIPGIGVGPDGEPGFTKSDMNKYKNKNRKRAIKRFKNMWSK